MTIQKSTSARRDGRGGWPTGKRRHPVGTWPATLDRLRALLKNHAQRGVVSNNALALGAIKTNVTKVVGTGLKLKSVVDRQILNLTEDQADAWERAAEREYRLATESIEIDAERSLPFSLLQGLAFIKVLEDGDVLVNMPRFARAGSPYKLKLQLIEAARLINENMIQDSARLAGGVEKDEYGAPVLYHVCNQHPGNTRAWAAGSATRRWTKLPAFGKASGTPLVLHLFDKTRPGQTRGVPYLAPVIELIKQLGRYTDAEVMAAVVSGMLTVFVTNETGDPTLGTPTELANPADTNGMELGYGSVIGLMPGESVSTVNPGRPNTAFDPFVQAIIRQIGVALELPFEVLIKHFTSSYSASRAALMEAWDYFRRRRHWLAVSLCQPVYEAIITEAIATGRLAAPGYFSNPLIKKAWLGTTWNGDAPYHLDPLKEINAAKARVDGYFTTRAEEVAAMPQGDDSWESKVPQFIKERKILDENDLLPEKPEKQGAVVMGQEEPEEKAKPAQPDTTASDTMALVMAALDRPQPDITVNVAPPQITVEQPAITVEGTTVNQAPVSITVENKKPGKTVFSHDAEGNIIGAEPAEEA
jgi:lambda family phage portal protein